MILTAKLLPYYFT